MRQQKKNLRRAPFGKGLCCTQKYHSGLTTCGTPERTDVKARPDRPFYLGKP
jgi:hypothetical protein